jgi:hypothetical protein
MKRALVLCGGGSLGSYEIGAWRKLKEKGLNFRYHHRGLHRGDQRGDGCDGRLRYGLKDVGKDQHR